MSQPSWPTLLQRALIAYLVAVGALGLGGCSGDAGSEASTDSNSVIVEAEPTPETFDPSDPDQLAGVSTSPSDLEAGDCFNEYIYRDRSDFLQQITTLVGCDGPHDREAYFDTEYPADDTEPIPADEVLRRWAEQACFEEFEAFVGTEYVLSALELGVIVPTFESWTEEQDRRVICFVYPDRDGYRLRSSVAGSGL